ncbi:MAG: HipA domain-containing protein [Labilibaculum antarcticum]
MSKEYLKKVKIEKLSGCGINYNIPVLKKHQYYVVSGFTITGDAPKEFIRAYEYGKVKKSNSKKWHLFIAKTGHKWYPIESITEYLLNQLGIAFGLKMAESNVVMAGGQIRFMSKYFLKEEEELVHGADLFGGYLDDQDFVEEVECQDLARDFFTLQFAEKSITFAYPFYDTIFQDFVKMLLFDALVGNNDRHFYNWGVVRHLTRDYKPVFSPIYDTARGLFWNESERKIADLYNNKSRLNTYIGKYSKNSRPKIGWDGQKNINHFKLVTNIYNNEFGISKSEIESLFLRKNIDKLIDVVRKDFVNLLSKERKEVIIECLNHRYDKIIAIFKKKEDKDD